MEAAEKLHHGERLMPGSCSYNLACLYSLNGKEGDCRKYLEASFAAGQLPNLDHLLGDGDLDPVRGSEWFQEFLGDVAGATP